MMMRPLLACALALVLLSGCDPADKELKCSCHDTLVADGTRHFFPFDKASKVTLYEYAENGQVTAAEVKLDSGGGFDSLQVRKSVALSREDVYELEKICLNRYQTCNNGTISVANDCAYDPHHCVVFSDSSNKTIAYLEVCYICLDTHSFPSGAFGSLCGDFSCDLAWLFIKNGFDRQPFVLESFGNYVPDTLHPSKGYYPD